MGHGEQADFFSCRGTIIFIKGDNVMYTACPGDKCNKKVTEDPSGGWRCEKCDRVYPEPDPRCVGCLYGRRGCRDPELVLSGT